VFDFRAGREHGVSGAASLSLNVDFDVGRKASRFGRDRLPVRPDDDCDPLRARADERLQRVRQHRAAGDFVQRLGSAGAHACALPGGQQDSQTSAAGMRRGIRGVHGVLL
jgi:hypothetical protein